MKRRDLRNASFRKGFKDRPTLREKPVRVLGLHPREIARRWPFHLSVKLMIREVGVKFRTEKELLAGARKGLLPAPRFDKFGGEPFWHRLEFEAFEYWKRASKVRRKARKARRARCHG
jgi:hypothetical protein